MNSTTVVLLGAGLLAGLTLADQVRGLAPGEPSTVARLLLLLLRGYRFLGQGRASSCRFTPSCSAYSVEVILRFGAVRGGWLTVRRLLRCAPWHPGGHDPAPPTVGRWGVPRRPSPPAPDLAPTSSSTGAPSC